MRKSILPHPVEGNLSPGLLDGTRSPWLALEEIARVELSSEDLQHPFEHALEAGTAHGWKSAEAGPQSIRLHFDKPQSIRRIRVQFREDQIERSQEFAIYATFADRQRRDVVRQQWTFSPGHSPEENEDYTFDLSGVVAIELEIDPGRHDKLAIATLQSLAISS